MKAISSNQVFINRKLQQAAVLFASGIIADIVSIKAQTVNSQIMPQIIPLGNTTKMTEVERQQLGIWIEQLK